MPHINMGIPSVSLQRPTGSHPQIPVQVPEKEQKPARLSMSLPKLNLHAYEPDFKQIYQAMFGKEPKIHEFSRQLTAQTKKE